MRRISGFNRVDICYSLGSLGLNVGSQAVVSYFMFYGTALVKLPASLLGLVFSISVLWDAVSDPLMGYISDNTSSKWGGKLPYLLLGSILMGLVGCALWLIPTIFSALGRFIYLLVVLLGFQTAVTIFSAPYQALSLDIASGQNQPRLQSLKSVFSIIGSLIPAVLPAIYQAIRGGGDVRFCADFYMVLGACSGMFMLVFGLISFFGTLSVGRKTHGYFVHISIKQSLNAFISALRTAYFRSALVGYTLILTASALLTGLGMHVFTFVFRLNAFELPLLLGELFVCTLVSQPFWLWLCGRQGKTKALRTGLWIIILGVVGLLLTYIGGSLLSTRYFVALLTPSVVVLGIGIGSTYPLPYAVMAESIEKFGGENRAVLFGSMTFIFKLAQASALLICGILLDVTHVAATAADAMSWAFGRQFVLLLLFAGCVCLLLFFAILRYREDQYGTNSRVYRYTRDCSCSSGGVGAKPR